MKRSRLRNIYLKNRSDNNKREYNKQRNYCVSLLQKTKTNCYANLNENDLTVNKQFGQTVKPWLSHKIKSSEKIALVEQRETLDMDGNINNEIVNDDVAVFSLRLLLTWKFLIFMGWFRQVIIFFIQFSEPYWNMQIILALLLGIIIHCLVLQMYLLLMLENLIQEKQLKIQTS